MEIPYLLIIITSIIHFIFGFTWYSMPVFGKAWMKLNKITKEQQEKAAKEGMIPQVISSLISSIVLTTSLFYLLQWTGIDNFSKGILFALIIWAGIIAMTHLGSILWEKNPIKLFLIHQGYWLISIFGLSCALIYFN